MISNNLPVADRQTLTMAASQHPLPNTGPYRPPGTVGPVPGQPVPEPDAWQAHAEAPGDIGDLARILLQLYPHYRNPVIQNSQTIGDRPVTTMTNPLPNYRPPAMVNTPLAQQLRTMIAQLQAHQQRPLVNTPLVGAPTQMGRM